MNSMDFLGKSDVVAVADEVENAPDCSDMGTGCWGSAHRSFEQGIAVDWADCCLE